MTLRNGLVAIGAVALLALGACSGSTTTTTSSTSHNTTPTTTSDARVTSHDVITTPVVTTSAKTTPPSSPSEDVVQMPATGNGPSVCEVGQARDQKGACAPCPDYEGCFTSPTDMQYFYKQIIATVQAYSKATYYAMPDVTNWYYIPTGATGTEACVDAKGKPAVYNDRSYEYCPGDKNVYVAEQQLWDYYVKLGDAGPAMAIAHEWGHHVQKIAGVFAPVQRTPEQKRLFTVQTENQADCIAGSWFAWEISQGVVNQDDYEDIDKMIAVISSADDNANRDHGTIKERTDSFILGMQSTGIAGCNAFFPNTPIFNAS